MIRIFTDSTSDLSPEMHEKYGITVLPLHVILGNDEYLDGVNITAEEIYAWSDREKTTPKTSAIGFEDTVSAFRKVLDAGDEIISFAISEDLSTTANVMRLAAEELGAEDRVSVINSKSLSTGIGLQILEACDMVALGKTRAEIVARLEEIRPRISASFVVDTLTFLHRGGRCSGVAALAGAMLKLHPEIDLVDGKMIPGRKFRGTLSRVITEYAKGQEEALLHAKKDRVFITTSGRCEASIEEVRAYLLSLSYFDEIFVTEAGSVVSSHCGPGTLGVLYVKGE